MTSEASGEHDRSTTGRGGPVNAARVGNTVLSLSGLVGGHPRALAQMYSAGEPTDPDELGDAPRGKILALEVGSDAFLLARSLLRALSTDLFPWRGKVFDHGGNSGMNVVFGKQILRFHAEVTASDLDGRPTLVLDYSDAAFKNPWPVRLVRDELRTIGDGVAIGPALLQGARGRRVVLWFGLERVSAN